MDDARLSFNRSFLRLLLLLAATLPAAPALLAQPGGGEQPFIVEYYYKAQWGHADEFIALFKKNHYPILQEHVAAGRMLRVEAVQPRYHATEEGRWDYRVTIVFNNVAEAFDASGDDAIVQRLYPDQETFRREEQRRFAILLAHWDVPVAPVALDQ